MARVSTVNGGCCLVNGDKERGRRTGDAGKPEIGNLKPVYSIILRSAHALSFVEK